MVSKKLAAEQKDVGRPDWNTNQSFALLGEQIQAKLKPFPVQKTEGMNFGGQTGRVKWQFDPKKFKALELLHITDVQLGHWRCKEDKLIEYRDWILDAPNRFMLWGGDMVDAGTKISVGNPWEQKCEPQGQIYKMGELWAPARHRILGYVGGNHEKRSVLTFGDLGGLISFVLQIPYSTTQQRVDIHYGDHAPFSVRLWHGSGASVTPGAKMNMIDRFMQRGDQDLYLTGHLHDAMTKFKWREVSDHKTMGAKLKKVGGAMSSSFLHYWHTYAEEKNLEPTGLMMARAILEPNGHWELTLR
jgi:Calcineurin-like phosphoesterase